MRKIFYRLLLIIFNIQQRFYTKKSLKLNNINYSQSTSKTAMNGACTLKFSTQTETIKTKVDNDSRKIVKHFIKSPDKLLDYIKDKGTMVYRVKYADKILLLIGENEGFITPQKGLKALYLNLMLKVFVNNNIELAMNTKEFFLLRNLPVNIYIMANHFHKWYGYKMQLPGYDAESQRKFKKLFNSFKDIDVEKLSAIDILSIKEAIARDRESIDFVLGLSKEYDGAKNALKKIKNNQGANI